MSDIKLKILSGIFFGIFVLSLTVISHFMKRCAIVTPRSGKGIRSSRHSTVELSPSDHNMIAAFAEF